MYMPVVSPARYQPRPEPRRRRPILPVLLVVIVIIAACNYLRPLPQPVATLNVHLPSADPTVSIPWPAASQASVAASGYGLLGTNGDQKPLATASMAKVITALCVLAKQPLNVGQTGPTYTISAGDVAIYNDYVSQYGSVLQVVQGEKLTEYQALEALMLPSANNVADSLVRWVFGNHDNYVSYANSFLIQNGLNSTHIGTDASGFDPSTTSTASDMTLLGLLALKNPVLMQIAGQSSADFPVVGPLGNYDTVLGQNGITGLKTGNSDADPGAFLFTSTVRVGSKDIMFTGAVMGAADLDMALNGASTLSASLQQDFEQVAIVSPNQSVGTIKTAWGTSEPITTTGAVQLVRWKATPLTETHTLDVHKRTGTIGTLNVSAGHAKSQTDLQLPHPLNGPSFWWRLTHH